MSSRQLKEENEADEKASQPSAPATATEIESPVRLSDSVRKKRNNNKNKSESSEAAKEASLHEFFVESLQESRQTMVAEAWRRLSESIYEGKPVGSDVAMDQTKELIKYNQAFVRDFVPAGLAFLMKKPAEPGVVKNILLKTLHLQGQEKKIDNFTVGDSYGGKKAFVAYTKDTGLQEHPKLQKQMDLTPELCLSDTCGLCKDMRWSYHDGGLWPTMLWPWAAAAEGKLLADPAAIIPDQAVPAGNEASHSGKRKRKDDDDPESAKPQSRFCMDPTLPVHVFWCDGLGTATFLGSIEDVQLMRDVLELEMQVHNISHSHNHYNEDHKVYYREWTNQGSIEISIVEPWPQFRRAVRGVILFETP